MFLIKTWCENTQEGKDYLQYNQYTNPHRILRSRYFVCKQLGKKLADVQVVRKFG